MTAPCYLGCIPPAVPRSPFTAVDAAPPHAPLAPAPSRLASSAPPASCGLRRSRASSAQCTPRRACRTLATRRAGASSSGEAAPVTHVPTAPLDALLLCLCGSLLESGTRPRSSRTVGRRPPALDGARRRSSPRASAEPSRSSSLASSPGGRQGPHVQSRSGASSAAMRPFGARATAQRLGEARLARRGSRTSSRSVPATVRRPGRSATAHRCRFAAESSLMSSSPCRRRPHLSPRRPPSPSRELHLRTFVGSFCSAERLSPCAKTITLSSTTFCCLAPGQTALARRCAVAREHGTAAQGATRSEPPRDATCR